MRRTLLLLVLLHWQMAACTTFPLDRSRDQFQEFFPSFQVYYGDAIEGNCSNQLRNYQNESLADVGIPYLHHKWAHEMVECILTCVTETDKASMAATGILLALLPVGLAQIGPTMSELSLLSSRRPLLAALLGYGTISPNPMYGMHFQDYTSLIVQAIGKRGSFARFGSFSEQSIFVQAIISLLEYALGIAATANCFIQVWRLTFRGVSLAPIIVHLRGVPESATLFGWAVFNLPVHLLAFCTFAVAFDYERSGPRQSKRSRFIRGIINELRPCVFGETLCLKERSQHELWHFMQNFLGASTRLLGTLHIMVGTILIGTVLFMPLGEAVPVIYTFVASALVTRLVLVFELQGLGRITKISGKQMQGKGLRLQIPNEGNGNSNDRNEAFFTSQGDYIALQDGESFTKQS